MRLKIIGAFSAIVVVLIVEKASSVVLKALLLPFLTDFGDFRVLFGSGNGKRRPIGDVRRLGRKRKRGIGRRALKVAGQVDAIFGFQADKLQIDADFREFLIQILRI